MQLCFCPVLPFLPCSFNLILLAFLNTLHPQPFSILFTHLSPFSIFFISSFLHILPFYPLFITHSCFLSSYPSSHPFSQIPFVLPPQPSSVRILFKPLLLFFSSFILTITFNFLIFISSYIPILSKQFFSSCSSLIFVTILFRPVFRSLSFSLPCLLSLDLSPPSFSPLLIFPHKPLTYSFSSPSPASQPASPQTSQ